MCITYFYLEMQKKEKKKKEWNLNKNVVWEVLKAWSFKNWKCKAVNEKVLKQSDILPLPTYLFCRSRRILFSGTIANPSSLFSLLISLKARLKCQWHWQIYSWQIQSCSINGFKRNITADVSDFWICNDSNFKILHSSPTWLSRF